MTSPCDWPRDEIRRFGYRVVDLIADYLDSLPGRPVFDPMPRSIAAAMIDSAPPPQGRSADEVLDRFARDIAPFPFGNGHPRFFGWVNSPPTVIGVFAEALAAA